MVPLEQVAEAWDRQAASARRKLILVPGGTGREVAFSGVDPDQL